MDETKIKFFRETLLKERARISRRYSWQWLGDALEEGRAITKKDVNKFVLGASMDFQMDANKVWKNSKTLTEEHLGDPDDLWETIASMEQSKWDALWDEHKYHRFHNDIREYMHHNAQLIVEKYQGDARNMWKEGVNEKMDECKKIKKVKKNLVELKGVGDQLAHMIMGALQDVGEFPLKPLPMKADVHVCRVTGRFFREDECSEKYAQKMGKEAYPENPWTLDRPLFSIGKNYCHASSPECFRCPLLEHCAYPTPIGAKN